MMLARLMKLSNAKHRQNLNGFLPVIYKAISCVAMIGPIACRVMASQAPPEANFITHGIPIYLIKCLPIPSPGIGDNSAMSLKTQSVPCSLNMQNSYKMLQNVLAAGLCPASPAERGHDVPSDTLVFSTYFPRSDQFTFRYWTSLVKESPI